MKRILTLALVFCLVITSVILPAAALAQSVVFPNAAVYSKNAITFTGSSQIIGDVITLSGKSTSSTPDLKYVTGTLYTNGDTDYRANFAGAVANYTGTVFDYVPYTYPKAPDASFFKDVKYNDGQGSLATTWWVSNANTQILTGSSLTESAYLKKLEIVYGSELKISVSAGNTLYFVVDQFINNGTLDIIGGGKVVLYVNSFESASGTHINTDGGADNLTIVCADNTSIAFSSATCNVVALGSLAFDALEYVGNIYCNNQLRMNSTGTFTGMVYCPFSDTKLTGDATIYGKIITNSLELLDNCKIYDRGVTDGLRLMLVRGTNTPVAPVEPDEPIIVEDEPVIVTPGTIILPGDVLQVVKYDVATGTFEYGKMTTRLHVPAVNFHVEYVVLNEATFEKTNGTVPQYLQDYCELIRQANEDVLQDMIRMGSDVSPFGRIDSEAWNNGLTVSPFSTPILERQGFAYSPDQIWLAMGNGMGQVNTVWLSVPSTLN